MTEKKTPEEISNVRRAAGAKGGAIGGKSKSAAKVEAVRKNAKLGGATGGRPRKDYDQLSDRQKKRRDAENGK